MTLERVSLKDGTGSGTLAKVNSSNQLSTRIVTVTPLHDASLRRDAYSWNAVSANIDTTDCMLLVANISTSKLLVIDHCYVRGDIAGQIDFKLTDVTGLTLAGTAVTGVSLNRDKPGIADASAFADETQSAATTVFFTYYQHLSVNAQGTTSPMTRIDFGSSIILPQNWAFGMDTILEPAAGFEATAIGYYIDA